MTAKGNRSAIEVLRSAPEVFDLSTFQRLNGLERRQAHVYLSRWAKAGLVQSAGPRVGVYFNLIRDPAGVSTRAAEALDLVHGTAVMNGASVLHAAGWTTQIPHRVTVAALSRQTFPQLDAFDVVPRRRSWFEKVADNDGMLREGGTYGLPSLTPAFALADAFKHVDGWRPDPDDLYLDDADPGEVRNAFRALRADVPDWLDELLPIHERTGP